MVSMIWKAHNQCMIQLDISMSLGEELFVPCILSIKLLPRTSILENIIKALTAQLMLSSRNTTVNTPCGYLSWSPCAQR